MKAIERDNLMNRKDAKERLEYLRGEIEAERISYGGLAELRGLAEAGFIDPGDTLLLEHAGVPEFQEYTVILLFPKWAADGSPETYTVYLNAGSPREALARARESMRSAVETDGGDIGGYADADIEVVHVIEGCPRLVTSEAVCRETEESE